MVSLSGDKARYLDFCLEHSVPRHLQPWWLDAVCGPDAWGVVVVGGPLAGAWPYFRTRRWGIPAVQNPPLTAYAGPWLAAGDMSSHPHKRLTLTYRALEKLITQLPSDGLFFQQTFRPEIQFGLPLYWAGFRQTTRYTYLLPDTSDLQKIYKAMKNTLRTDLRNAAASVETVNENAPELLFAVNALSFDRKGLRQPYSLNSFRCLFTALTERGQGAGFVARIHERDTPCASLFLAFDDHQASVVLAGVDAGCNCPGALHLLYWKAIEFCSERGIGLDFEGSMDKGIEHVFRAFGGQPVPYFQVRRWMW